jgi:hypothetical protein
MKKLLSLLSVILVVLSSDAASARVIHTRTHVPRAAAPQHVACTVLGCQPIPAACIPKEEHSFSGIPIGFDTIVCPPGVWPF